MEKEEILFEPIDITNHARSHRLAALANLTLGIAHEIRNPLAVIRSNAEMLKNNRLDKNKLEQFSETIIKHADRIEDVVQRIHDLSHHESQKKEKLVNLNQVVEKVADRITFPNNITLVKELETIPDVMGIEEDLEKAIYNLIENSLNSMIEGGTLAIITNTAEGKVILKISDTGIGIPKNHLEKIFDPFYSTHHKAAGLGLPISYRIIKEHNGQIKVGSIEGKGTTITLLFNVLE